MDIPFELPEAAGSRSFYHKAASLSLFGLPVSFGALALAVCVPSDLGPVGVALVPFVILICGVVSGVVALFGISRHGTRGILVKALCGIVIPVLFIVLSQVAFHTGS